MRPVAVPGAFPSHQRNFRDLLALSDDQLAITDPLEMNLLVAKEIPCLSHLDVQAYQKKADEWAVDFASRLRQVEGVFYRTPQHWKNDINYFRLGHLCWYIDEVLQVRYREDQKFVKTIKYIDAADLFLNGVMDSRLGTCGNMAALHVAIAWRLHWPVSLACCGSHFIVRFDDGKVTHNIEATKTGIGSFQSHPDEYYLNTHSLTWKAVTSGSDLRALTARELLGVFVGAKARHYADISEYALSDQDYLLARYLFPLGRYLLLYQIVSSMRKAAISFDPVERGHPIELIHELESLLHLSGYRYALRSESAGFSEILIQETKHGSVNPDLSNLVFSHDVATERGK